MYQDLSNIFLNNIDLIKIPTFKILKNEKEIENLNLDYPLSK